MSFMTDFIVNTINRFLIGRNETHLLLVKDNSNMQSSLLPIKILIVMFINVYFIRVFAFIKWSLEDECVLYAKQKKKKLFQCPKTLSRALKWLEVLEISENHVHAASGALKLCGMHFKPTDFTNSLQNKLNRSAVPSLDLKIEQPSVLISTTTPSTAVVTSLPVNLRFNGVVASGRRWTEEEKLLCLTFWKRSPKGYRLLRKLIALPSINTLRTLLRLIPLKPGVNDCIMSYLTNMVSNLKVDDKFCCLIFDEMSLREGLSFNLQADRIIGHVDMDTGSKGKEYANSVIVFMLQGLKHNWKQPIAYYFCRNLTYDHLSRMIIEVIRLSYNLCKF